MPLAWSAILRALFVAYVAATAVHVGWVIAHEPFVFDAWNVAVDTSAKPFSVGHFFEYWWYEYTHSNPRIGQPFTYLGYKLEYFAPVAAPIAYVGMSLAIFVLGAGRWPSWRRGRDLALWTLAIGFIWFALPDVGKTLFNRAYGANYFYTAAIQLWFLVPLRLTSDGRGSAQLSGRDEALRCAAYFAFGVIAGMCNEHTGPTLALFTVLYAWWTRKRTRNQSWLAWAGAVGVVVGFALIFFAPGQGERYDGLAQRVGLIGKLLQRGVTGNLEILRALVVAAAPLLGLIVLLAFFSTDAEARRKRMQLIGVALAASVLVAITMFVSPKLGPRFYLMPMALLLAGFVGLADVVLLRPRGLVPFCVLAVAASGYAAAHTVGLYSRVFEASNARLAQLAASRPGSIVTIEAFEQVPDSWWFLGDDFHYIHKRELAARYFALRDVVLRGYDPDAPLGVSDVRLVPEATLAPRSCLAEHGGLALDEFRGLDISTIHRAMRTAVDQLRGRAAGASGRVERVDLTVQFIGERPALPRKTLLVGRWTPGLFEGYVGAIRREGRSTTRKVIVPKQLTGTDVFIYQVGGEAKQLDATNPRYVPWKTGVYWVLACRPDECFVIAATRQGA